MCWNCCRSKPIPEITYEESRTHRPWDVAPPPALPNAVTVQVCEVGHNRLASTDMVTVSQAIRNLPPKPSSGK